MSVLGLCLGQDSGQLVVMSGTVRKRLEGACDRSVDSEPRMAALVSRPWLSAEKLFVTQH